MGIDVTLNKNLCIVMQQYYSNCDPYRLWLGAPLDGKKMNEVIKIKVTQGGKEIPQHIEYDKMIWCGLSWGVAEITQGTLTTINRWLYGVQLTKKTLLK